MQRPVHVMIQERRQVSPQMVGVISGVVLLEAAVVYFVAASLTFHGAPPPLPQPIDARVFDLPRPKTHLLVPAKPKWAKPTTVTVPAPPTPVDTPLSHQVTVAGTPASPVAPPVNPPANPKAADATAPVSIGRAHSCANEYPATAVRLNEQGTTSIKFIVNTDGSVSDVQIVNSSGYETLDDAAIRCASSWRYKPAEQGGQPVAASWTTNVQWRLTNGAR